MKIKRFNESIRDKMTGVEGVPDFTKKRNEILNEEIQKINCATDFLKWVINDMQLDINSEYYFGYINIGLDVIEDEDLEENFKCFVDLYNNGWNEYLNKLFKELKLKTEKVDLDETIIHSTIETKNDLWK